jgi:tRNA uridine 5-carboxymethylaminomethyl modification enzyme
MEPWYPRRDEAYMGVLIDDLITSGTREPYRMFTSRAEYRLMLREDNADIRLTPIGRQLGLVDDKRWAAFSAKQEAVEAEKARLDSYKFVPEKVDQAQVESVLGEKLTKVTSATEMLRRPNVDYDILLNLMNEPQSVDDKVAEQVMIQAKYSGYINRQQSEIDRVQRNESMVLPVDLDYKAVRGLSNEVREKLEQVRPQNLGQAARISGVTPAAVSLLLVHLKRSGLSEAS